MNIDLIGVFLILTTTSLIFVVSIVFLILMAQTPKKLSVFK